GHLQGRHSFPTRRSSDLTRDRASAASRSSLSMESLADVNHSTPTSSVKKLDLRAPCPPWRMRTVSTWQPGERARATALIAHLRKDRKSTRLNSSHVKISY